MRPRIYCALAVMCALALWFAREQPSSFGASSRPEPSAGRDQGCGVACQKARVRVPTRHPQKRGAAPPAAVDPSALVRVLAGAPRHPLKPWEVPEPEIGLHAAMQEIKPLLDECYALDAAHSELHSAFAMVRMHIAMDGVHSVVVDTSLDDGSQGLTPDVSECLLETLYRLNLKPVAGQSSMMVTYPVGFGVEPGQAAAPVAG